MSKAVKSRWTWSIKVVQWEGKFEFHILWKDCKNCVSFYETKDKSVGVLGAIETFHYFTRTKNTGETVPYVRVTNSRGYSVSFTMSTFQPAVEKPNSFNTKISSYVNGKMDTLVEMLNLINRSANFVSHSDDHHDSLGFRTDGEGYQRTNLINSNVSLKVMLQIFDITFAFYL